MPNVLPTEIIMRCIDIFYDLSSIQLLPLLEASLVDPSPALSTSPLYVLLTNFLTSLTTSSTSDDLLSLVWSLISDTCERYVCVADGEDTSHVKRVGMLINKLHVKVYGVFCGNCKLNFQYFQYFIVK